MFLNDQERSETIWACRFCMMCQTADRVGEVVRNESYTPRGRGAIIHALEKGLLKWDENIAEIMYSTLNDGRLQEWCVGNYDHDELVIDTRAKLFEKGLMPEEIAQHFLKLKSHVRNNEGLINSLKKAGIAIDEHAKTLLYIGCNSTKENFPTIGRFAALLNAVGIGFQVFSEEPICGHAYYQGGDFKSAAEISKKLADELRRIDVSKVIVLEADCYRMLSTRTKRFGGDTTGISFEHFSTTLCSVLVDKKIEVKKPLDGLTATYQDPCVLARYCGLVDEPRKIIAAIGMKLVEMDPAGKLAFCCGGGGLLPVYKPEIAAEISTKRCREAIETKAAYLVTACFGCHKMLSIGYDKEIAAGSQKIVHLIDLVADSCSIQK